MWASADIPGIESQTLDAREGAYVTFDIAALLPADHNYAYLVTTDATHGVASVDVQGIVTYFANGMVESDSFDVTVTDVEGVIGGTR